jgi:shikimate dehydrogenase
MSMRFGLLGKDISASLSPALHQAAAKEQSQDVDYLLLDVGPEQLGEILQSMRTGHWSGLNVTAPYKRWAWQAVDDHGPVARLLGVVNTIAHSGDGRLIGYNTDRIGMAQLLANTQCTHPLILGAGGAARVAVHVLAARGSSSIRIVNRTAAAIEDLGHLAPGRIHAVSWSDAASALLKSDVVVNCLPPFLGHRLRELPFDTLAEPGVFIDTNYGPSSRELHDHLRSLNLSVTDGLQMLIGQGIDAFRIWTGCRADADIVSRAVHESKKQHA